MSRLAGRVGRFVVPHVPDDVIEGMHVRRAHLARLYNRLADSPMLRWRLLGVGPLFRCTGTARALEQRGRGDAQAT